MNDDFLSQDETTQGEIAASREIHFVSFSMSCPECESVLLLRMSFLEPMLGLSSSPLP